MKWSTHISEFENLLPNTRLQVEKALHLYENLIPKRHGKVVFLAGERGSGRSEALKALAETFSHNYKDLQVISGKFTDGKYLSISAKSGGRKGNADAIGNSLSMLGKTIGFKTGLPVDLLLEGASFLFDFIGQLLQTSASVKNALGKLNESSLNIAELPNAIKRLLRSAIKDSPIICLFDDFDEARYEWHEFLDSFAEEIGKDLPILFFVSLRGSAEVTEHQKDESNLEMVIRRALSRGLAEWWHLRPMSQEEVAKWIDADTELGMVAQLHGVTSGIPRWVKELWRDWKTGGIINFNERRRCWEFSKDKRPTLNPFNDVLKDLFALLLKTDDLSEITEAREVLSIAALEGTRFTAEVLALATNRSRDDLIDFLDDYLALSEENPNGLLREGGFLTFEVQPNLTANVFRYRFVSDWHWQVLDRYGLTDVEKVQKSGEMITALQIVYEGNEKLIAKSLAHLYQNIGNQEQAKHFQTIASYARQREIIYHQAHWLMTFKTDDWDKHQCYQNAKFLYAAGEATSLYYPYDKTIRIFEYTENLARRAGTTELLAWATIRSGDFHHFNGDDEIARNKAEISLKLFENAKNKYGKAASLYLLAGIAFYQGSNEEAKSKLMQCLQVYIEVGYRQGEEASLNFLGELAYYKGDLKKARSRAFESLRIFQETQKKQYKAVSLNLLSRIAHAEGDYKEAKSRASECLQTYEEVGDKQGEAMSVLLSAEIAICEGDYKRAKSKAVESLLIQEALGDRRDTGASLRSLATIAYYEGDYEEAKSKAVESFLIDKEVGFIQGKAATLKLLGQIAHAEGDDKEAKSKAKESLLIGERIGDKRGKAISLGLLAKVVHKEGKKGEAICLASLSRQIFFIIGSSEFDKALSNFNYLLNELDYAKEQVQEIVEKTKAEYDKDEGKSWLAELLKDL